MMTFSGIRNALWCTLAFAIVACASAPLQLDGLAPGERAIARTASSTRSSPRLPIVAARTERARTHPMVGTP